MRILLHKKTAFTFIELILVITLLAILSTAVILGWRQNQIHAQFRDLETKIISMIQKARGLSLSNLTIENADESIPVEYYLLNISETSLSIQAIGQDSAATAEEIDVLEFPEGFSLDTTFEVYYFPPYGEVCWESDCPDDFEEEKTFTLSTEFSNENQEFGISIYGGYPELQ